MEPCKLVVIVLLLIAAFMAGLLPGSTDAALLKPPPVAAPSGRLSGVTRNGCHCANKECRCCEHIEADRISLNATVCVDLAYLSEDIGLSLTATVNNFTFINKTVSVRNPPPICVETPVVHAGALCLRLHDVDAHTTWMHACAAVEASLKHISLTEVELGCFTLGTPPEVTIV